MKSLRLIASILDPIARIAAAMISLVWVYALLIFILSVSAPHSISLPISMGGGGFVIYYPFTHTPFLLGDYTPSYLVPMLLALCFYSLFFWLLAGVFAAFRQAKLFVPRGVRRLSRFYITNLTIPPMILIVAIIYKMGAADMLMITVLHAVLGVFAFFMAAIFKEGLLLQQEQDLTL